MGRAMEEFTTKFFGAEESGQALDEVDKEFKVIYLKNKLALLRDAGFETEENEKRITEELRQLTLTEKDLPTIGRKIDFVSEEGDSIHMAFPKYQKLPFYKKDVPYDVVRLVAENREKFSDFYIREPREGRAKIRFKELDFDPLLFGVAKSDGQHYLLAQWGRERTIKLKSIRTRQRWGKAIRKILLEGMLFSPLIMATLLSQVTDGFKHNFWWLLLFCFGATIPIRAGVEYFPTPFRSFFYRTGENKSGGDHYDYYEYREGIDGRR